MSAASGYQDYCKRVESYIQGHYGIPIVTRDIPDPLTGDLDGSEIHVDYALDWEQRLFLVLHLFGHTAQWNLKPDSRTIGQPLRIPVPPELLPAEIAYEKEAGEYALWLLHRLGIAELDQWLSDYTAADMAFLLDYYQTGDKKDFRRFWRANTPLLRPSPVPEFRPQKWVSRLDGIVL